MPILRSKPRHPICALFDGFLDVIIADQDTQNSSVAEAMRLELGESVAASIMQAAGIRRLRLKHQNQEGTQKSTGASSPQENPNGTQP